MMFNGWLGVVFLAIAGVFGHHLWLGWRTRIVRFPMSILVIQEFEYDKSPANFWGVMAANLFALLLGTTAALFILVNVLTYSTKPIGSLLRLDGCYEGEGLPDFMRPRVHWELRVKDGTIFDRAGAPVSQLRLLASTSNKTPVAFPPGIRIVTDERKISTVYVGEVVNGTAYVGGGHETISLENGWDVLLKTNCG